MAFVVFPTQLFETQYLTFSKYESIYIVEEPVFFYDPVFRPNIRPNKVKLAFLRAAMRCYYDTLTARFPKKRIEYIAYKRCVSENYAFLKDYEQVTCFDPIDHELINKLTQSTPIASLQILPSPDLLIPKSTLQKYYNKHTSKHPKHKTFFEFVKKELNLFPKEFDKNLDKFNRSPPPSKSPNVSPMHTFKPSSKTLKYYDEAINYVNHTFPNHIGNPENAKHYPITSKDSYQVYKQFLQTCLVKYGKYQDAVMQEDPFMYHSIISPMMNIGLLNPKKVVEIALDYYHTHSQSIPLSSIEGFIRQIVGWRTFMQSLYIFKYSEIHNANSPNNQLRFRDAEAWYSENINTGIPPMDEEIRKAVRYGYSHHIVRLMIFMNFFILCELHPQEIYNWFMTVVAIDAYPAFMIPNIYVMGSFYKGIMSRPYLSSSNYIKRMTMYRMKGHWTQLWDALYHDFISRKPKEYVSFYSKSGKYDNKLASDFKTKYFTPVKNM